MSALKTLAFARQPAATRALTHEDIPQVLAIEAASFPVPWSKETFAEEITCPGRVWRVCVPQVGSSGEPLPKVPGRALVPSEAATPAQRVLGFGGMMIVGDEAHLMDIAVAPEYRGQGIGRRLLWDLAADAHAMGAERITLEVRPSNTEALGLYMSCGFDIVGRRHGYYPETSEDALIMWSRPLAQALRAMKAARAGSDLILALETSCDETAASVVRGGREELSSVVASQIDFHARFGGVVPEIASRKHTEAIVAVAQEALDRAHITFADIDALAVTQGPGLVGALVVGLAYAKGLALGTDLPLIGVNHLEGHIYAARLLDPGLEAPLIVLLISGGHTAIVHVPAWGHYEVLGRTLDDAAGEAFDKVAKLLGLGYPGGPVISGLAIKGDPAAIAFPRPMIRSKDYNVSLSGLKTAVIQYVERERAARREINVPDVAASFQAAVVDVQVEKTVRAAQEYGVTTVVMAGGVAANPGLRERLSSALAACGKRLSVPPADLCTDNASMIATAAHDHLAAGRFLGLSADAVPNMQL